VLRAVIEEARRRARQRRERNALLLALLACVGAAAYFSLNRGGGRVAPALERIEIIAGRAPMKNGALTIMDVRASSRHEGPAGWYGFSSVDAAGRLHTLVRCPDRARWCGDLESIDWSPDGRRLAFAVTSFGAVNPYNGLHVVDLRTRGDRQLLKAGQYHEYDWHDIDWSPDGRRLAYATDGRVVVINADGSGRSVLDTGTTGHDHAPSWSPDGRWIAFVMRHDGVPSVYAIRTDGSQRRLLVRHGGAPAWSPDGTRIAFRAANGIEFVSPNGKLLAPGPPFRVGTPVGIDGPPVWSPDGTKLAMSNSPEGTYVMNADGSQLTRLTTHSVGVASGERPRPAWRPAAPAR
jgi:WD40-like Beta Propeller Repeat